MIRSVEGLRLIEARLREAGVELVSASGAQLSGSTVDRFTWAVVSACDEFREKHREDTRRGIEARRRRLQGE